MKFEKVNNDKIKVWKSFVDDAHVLHEETVLDRMEHYVKLFNMNKQNNREEVLKNTYALNELLHKMDIDEKLRSQFVGTTLLYLKNLVEKMDAKRIDEELQVQLKTIWSVMDGKQIRAAIESTLESLLDGSDNKAKKVELLQKNFLNDQKVKKLTTALMTPLAAMVPKVTIWVTESAPYFCETYSMARYLSAYSKSTSISGMDTRSGFKKRSKRSWYFTGSMLVIPVQ